ncbi:hypothetical protein DV113_001625 [Geotrichum candidum]|uniref:Mitochondrial group I intron splicing factor CCM1 n=2 Tax=Geotrichum candidum TaxID=1173061 RepID=A0A0J9XC36_GEOCN|nr:hypothetical protein DV454_001372 [Geotrichum candidum]KAF5117869.1 hypothetical protein DV452_002198 [Geotrichum candidum]KAF7500334.1 hypothetical protein DV113_001625 [Geotrichum candidum]KAI8132844.1 hypothetical protein DUD61_003518 [Geotrichum candidum]CDO55088.1 conserved hypothetical protein [Geotrichum candidum]
MTYKHVIRSSQQPLSSIVFRTAARQAPALLVPAAQKHAHIIREYSSKPKSRFSPSGIYSSFVKKALATESWESVENFDQSQDSPDRSLADRVSSYGRALRESLAAPPGKDSLDFYLIKANLLKLLDALPQCHPNHTKRLKYSTYKSTLETSILLILKESESSSSFTISMDEIINIYTLLIRNGSADLKDSAIISKLFSVIQTCKDLSQERLFASSLEFLRFLDAQGKELEAEKLLQWILQVSPALTEASFNLALQHVSHPNIKYKCIPLLFETCRKQGNVPSQAALEFALMALKAGQLHSPLYQKVYSDFVTTNFINTPSQHSSVSALILILESFLESNDSKGAGKFLALFDSVIDVEGLHFKSPELKDQLYKLLIVAHLKFLGSKSMVESFLSKIGQDPEIDFYWSLHNEPQISNVVSIFETARSNGLEITDAVFNNAVDILLQNHTPTEIQNLLSTISVELGIDSTMEVYETLLNNALSKNDVELALSIFHTSLGQGALWTANNRETLDGLIVAMCETMQSEVVKVFRTYTSIRTFTKTVGYEATAALLKLFLSYDYVGDTEQLLEDELGLDSQNFDPQSKPKIYFPLYNYALASNNSENAWSAYTLSEKYFDSPYESYYTIMNHFCNLLRPDVALLIFKNMRNRSKTSGSKPPDEVIYRLLFHEFGKCGYAQGIFELHTFFKMDISVDATVPLLNEIMHAHYELEDVQQAVNIWTEIASFPTGPNHDSYNIMMKVCTKVSIEDVERMWQTLLQSPTVEPDDSNYRQYLIANCYHGFYLRALDIAKVMPVEPSKETIAALYNWTLIEHRKESVAKWALENHPEKWNALLAEPGALKTYLLDEKNPDNDSEAHLRKGLNEKLELDGRTIVPQVIV